MLADKIGAWLDESVTIEHVVDGSTGVHSTQNFLQWHRTRIRQLEDYLLKNGGSQFVPLPKWVPSQVNGAINPIPGWFDGYAPVTGTQYPNYFDSDYNDFLDTALIKYSEEVLIYPAFVDFDLLYQGGICTFMVNNFNIMQDAGRFSDHLKLEYHAEGHSQVGLQPDTTQAQNGPDVYSAFSDFRSSNYLLFWLYHAWIDEIWYWWESECDANYTIVDSAPITSSMAWFSDEIVKGTITVESGVELTILANAQFQDSEYFSRDTKIIVKSNGKLVIQGVLSGVNVIGTVGDSLGTGVAYKSAWDGIIVEDGGEVIIDGGGIENARIGIHNPGGGGKIMATDATFKNNRSDVVIGTIGLGSAWNEDNQSSFTNCSFIFDEPLRDVVWASNTIGSDDHRYYRYNTQKAPYPRSHVELHNVGEITFSGCSFSNGKDIPLVSDEYVSTGIFAFGSEFTCDQQTSFSGLRQGISAWTYFAANPISNTLVDDCTFTDNLIGIRLGSSEFAEVLNSTFNIPDEVPVSEPYILYPVGIFSGGGAGIEFIGNTFTTNDTSSTPNNLGIYARRTCLNRANWIADNDFTDVRFGVQTVDDNTELQISCNDFQGFGAISRYAISASSGELADQGDCNFLPAGNSWDHSNCGGTPSQIAKSSAVPGFVPGFNYEHHSDLEPDNNCISTGIMKVDCAFDEGDPGTASCEDVFEIFEPKDEAEREQYITGLTTEINNTTDAGALKALKRVRLSVVYHGTRHYVENRALDTAYTFLNQKEQQGISIYPGDLAALAVAYGNYAAATNHINLMDTNDPNKALIQFIKNVKQSGRGLHELTLAEKEWLEDAADDMDQCSSRFPEFPANNWEEPSIVMEAIPFAEELEERSIEEEPELTYSGEMLRVFPNPTTGVLNVEWGGKTNATVKLYSATGYEAWSGILSAGQTNQLILNHLPSGIYLLSLQSDGEHIWHKVVLSN